MLAVIIPTFQTEATLPALLAQLGNVRVVVSDAGSTDGTLDLALGHGAVIAIGTRSRGAQMARGADLAGAGEGVRAYLFLHADCQLLPGWSEAVSEALQTPNTAWYFRYQPNASGLSGFCLRALVGLRGWAWRLPYGDQGLLIPREMYEALGGYDREKPLFEDVDMVDRIKARFGRAALQPLPIALLTDVSDHLNQGVWRRGWRNLGLLKAYRRGAPVEDLLRDYI